MKKQCTLHALLITCISLSGMSLTEVANDVIRSIAYLLSSEKMPIDYHNYALETGTHTQKTVNLFWEYEKNVTRDYVNLMCTCKRMYTLLNLKNRLPNHLSWNVFTEKINFSHQNGDAYLKIVESPLKGNALEEQYKFELTRFGKSLKWKLTCNYFNRSSRRTVSKNDILSKSYIDRRSPLWNDLYFAKVHSNANATLIQSFRKDLDSNNANYIHFVCIGSFDWLDNGVPLDFVKKYFLNV